MAITGVSRSAAFRQEEQRSGGHRRWAVLLRHATPYAFLSPFLLFLLAFGAFPILYAIYLSFTSKTGDGTNTGTFADYSIADHDFRLPSAAENVGLYIVIWLPTLLVLVFVAALLLAERPGRFSTFLRVLFYLPGSLAGSAAVLVWLFMFDPSVSPFKPLYRLLGLANINQVVSPSHIAVLIAIMALSTGSGSWIVIIYGALRNVPQELLDAGQMDGCGRLRLAWHIKVPQVARYAVLVAILSFATGTQVFVEPSILFSTGVGFVSPTWSINELTYVYAFTYGRFGLSAALSVELFLISLALAVVVILKTGFYSRSES